MVKMNGEHSLDSNNDESFVVLERCTEENITSRTSVESEQFLPSVIQNIPHSVDEPSCSNQIISPRIIVPLQSIDSMMNMNSEEIQKRVQDLIKQNADLNKENADLKVTLQQHNLAMKQQFQTLKMWQDEVYKVHQTHKEKFEETKQFINKITAENKELKRALAEKPKGEIQNNEANSKLLAENAALQKQINTLQEKLVQREKKYLQPSVKEAELNSVVEQLTRQLEVAERARRQLSIDVERLTAQQSRMHPPIGAPIVMLEESASHENVLPVEQLKRYNDWSQRLEKMEDEINRGSSLTSWMPVESANLSFEVHELRKLLTQEQKLSASRKEAIGEVRQYFQRLLSDYQTLYHDWEWLKQEQSIKERDDAYEEVQRNGYREKVDNLTAQLMECKEALNGRNSYIESLKDQIEKLQSENEAIELLKAQVNVYQTDFEAERKSREDLVGVKEKLAEDLRLLQRRNQQLIDELKVYQGENQLNGQQARRSTSHSPSPASTVQPVIQPPLQLEEESQSPQPKFTCPNPECNKVFKLYKPLERHVVQCLRLED
ncbi:uncharacterized protein LOC142321788 isoform X2 [Lycorma delicatula]|uniref:uncharacterized protein LOC142321788 isoform X2 n=1 Tax=Lycorma delicatula TaxID=130591 RepID=UPI003F517472